MKINQGRFSLLAEIACSSFKLHTAPLTFKVATDVYNTLHIIKNTKSCIYKHDLEGHYKVALDVYKPL